MKSRWILGIFLILCVQAVLIESNKRRGAQRKSRRQGTINDEAQASQIIDEVCAKMLLLSHESTKTSWNYATNLTVENQRINSQQGEIFANYAKEVAKTLSGIDQSNFKNETLKRLIRNLSKIGDAKLNEDDFKKLTDATNAMQETYSTVKIPSYKDKSKMVSLEPEITEIFTNSDDPEELKYYWEHWYNSAGKPSKKNFLTYVELRNKAAKLNDYKDGSETWLNSYEDPGFEQQVENILAQMRPLFLQFHGYVRHQLAEYYGKDVVDVKKPIPMHLLGNIWAQQWHIDSKVLPYPVQKAEDVNVRMKELGYTASKMFKDAEKFFISIGLKPMPATFWTKSVMEKPTDGREIICHASAWDFGMNNDVRIKQCSRITEESYITVHHEMGHVEYYLYYDHLPIPFRTGANPGFHEAIGDTIALSVSTPKHLHKKGLIKELAKDKNAFINQLFRMGLDKLAFLSYAYTFDKYRWELFRGNIPENKLNDYYWELREQHSGVAPPVKRTNDDFDVPAKYHGSADVEYLRYFVSYIIQFQFHKAACIKANEYEPNNPDKLLSECDIYDSKEAGEPLKKMLSLGASKPWHDALEVMTGERKLDASALIEYFQPLHEWLLEENKKLGVNIGW